MRRFLTAFSLCLLLAGAARAMGNYEGTPGGGGQGIPGGQVVGGAPSSIPEPAALVVFGVGAGIIGYALHRRRAK